MGDFAILKTRSLNNIFTIHSIGPEGSFFGVFAEEMVMDSVMLEEEINSFDHFQYLFFRVCKKQILTIKLTTSTKDK